MKRLVLSLVLAIAAVLAVTGVALAQPAPEFKLGFKALADQIPGVVGQPLENEHWGANGDSLQQTTTGLMVWRKADNWTAFTNGSRTWVNGPAGVQDRDNNARFPFEDGGQNNSELYLGKYQPTDSLKQVSNGKTYELQTLQATGAPYAVVINDGAKAQLSKLIAEEGQRNGFNNVKFIALGPNDSVDGLHLSSEAYSPTPNSGPYGHGFSCGSFGSQRVDNTIIVYWKEDSDIPFDNHDVIENAVKPILGARVVTATVTGGTINTQEITPDQWTRIMATTSWDKGIFDLVASTTN